MGIKAKITIVKTALKNRYYYLPPHKTYVRRYIAVFPFGTIRKRGRFPICVYVYKGVYIKGLLPNIQELHLLSPREPRAMDWRAVREQGPVPLIPDFSCRRTRDLTAGTIPSY